MNTWNVEQRVARERDALAGLIAASEQGFTQLKGYRHIIGVNAHGRAICLVWHGNTDPELSPDDVREVEADVAAQGTFTGPMHVWGGVCAQDDGDNWLFYPITAAMHEAAAAPASEIRTAA